PPVTRSGCFPQDVPVLLRENGSVFPDPFPKPGPSTASVPFRSPAREPFRRHLSSTAPPHHGHSRPAPFAATSPKVLSRRRTLLEVRAFAACRFLRCKMLWYIQLIFLCCPVERNKYLHWFIKHVVHLAEKRLYHMPRPLATPPCLDPGIACP